MCYEVLLATPGPLEPTKTSGGAPETNLISSLGQICNKFDCVNAWKWHSKPSHSNLSYLNVVWLMCHSALVCWKIGNMVICGFEIWVWFHYYSNLQTVLKVLIICRIKMKTNISVLTLSYEESLTPPHYWTREYSC